ncbi:MAG: type II toxin-antitoxin system RelE/ParE family toxin [Burkholderiaceae bacterium]
MFDIQDYLTLEGADPYSKWLSSLGDRQARARVLVRVGRMANGHFGDVKPVGHGVWEARVDWGPGYRIYYAQAGKRLILLLFGGDKRRQQSDIKLAHEFWEDWQQRRKLK